jgi:hypothetical protein
VNIKVDAQATTNWGSQYGADGRWSVDRANVIAWRDLTRETNEPTRNRTPNPKFVSRRLRVRVKRAALLGQLKQA